MAPDEGRNAEVGREMKNSGDWLVPTYNGLAYLDKPAFYFKAVALSLAAFGENETAARLPSALFGLALVGVTFLFCRKVHGARCGWIAASVIGATPLFLANSRTVIFDIALALFVCSAIFAGYLAEQSDVVSRRRWYLAGAACAGLGTLVKGPVGFVLPLLVLLVHARVEGHRGAWKRLFAPLNFAVFFAIALPWFVGLCLRHPDFLHYGLVEESFHRFTSARTFHRSEPFYFYIVIVAALFFPWSLLLPEAMLATWRGKWARAAADRLCITWALVVIVFFSISQSKLPGYILSVTVASGILMARLLGRALDSNGSRPARLVVRTAAVFGMICLAAAVAAVIGMSRMQALAGPLRIPVPAAEQLGHAAIPLAGVLLACGVAAWIAWLRRSPAIAFLCLALFPPLAVQSGVGVASVIFEAKSGRVIARALPSIPDTTEIATLNCFPNGLLFYLERYVTLFTRDGEETTSNYIMYRLRNDAQWPDRVVHRDQLESWLNSRTNAVYLISRNADRKRMESLASARGAAVTELPSGYLGLELAQPRSP
ncbi:MAG: glycosyltransferase family 39 protein [Verrucomicrobiota bacterium]